MFWISVTLAFKEIRNHVLRSLLTTLGVIIGVASVITMVTVGNGSSIAIQKRVESLGTNILFLTTQQADRNTFKRVPLFNLENARQIKQRVEGVSAVAPLVFYESDVIFNSVKWKTKLNGTTDDYLIAQQWPLDLGRNFTPYEASSSKQVCILGSTVVKNLFYKESLIGKTIKIGNINCQVIGIAKAKGNVGYGERQDDFVLLPIKVVQRHFLGAEVVSLMRIAVAEGHSLPVVEANVASVVRNIRNIKVGEKPDFSISSTDELRSALSDITRILTAMLGTMAAISLIIGGIGIMNIMLVTVTERTREIGIRLAIGALGKDVKLQFLIEAVVLSSIGGLIGLLLSIFTCLWLTSYLNVPYVFDYTINLVAFLSSAFVGVIFGYFPAQNAAKLNPISALRHNG